MCSSGCSREQGQLLEQEGFSPSNTCSKVGVRDDRAMSVQCVLEGWGGRLWLSSECLGEERREWETDILETPK